MDSINPQITAMHTNYNTAMGLMLQMRPTYERWYWDALQAGITPEMLSEVIRHRQKRISAGIRHPECVCIRNLIGSEEAIDNFIEESAMLAAKKRMRVIDPARASVLAATHRPADHGEPAKEPVIAGVALGKALTELKRAIGG